MKYLKLSIVNYFFFILLYIHKLFAYLNIDEFSNFQYDVDIVNIPKHSDDYLLENDNIVLLSSKFGQKYQCSIEHPKDDLKTETQTIEKSIIELLQPIEEGPCLQYSNGWWTYEVCYKKYIRQFHQSEDKVNVGDIIYLGYYDSEFDWNSTQQKENAKYYHSQNYINGSLCDLTKQQRTAEIRVKCRSESSEKNGEDVITLVEEPSTCSYVITVETPRLCTHPQMRYKVEKDKFGIQCTPLLDSHQYQEYLQEIDKNKEEDSIYNDNDDDDDEYENADEEYDGNINSNKVKEDEINMLTKIMVKIGNNIGTKLKEKNNAEIKDEHEQENSKLEMSSSAMNQLDDIHKDLDIKSHNENSFNDQELVSDKNNEEKTFEVISDKVLNNNKKTMSGESDYAEQDVNIVDTDTKINSKKMNDNEGLIFISEGESIRQEMEDILDLDFENVITQSINEILDENNDFIQKENVNLNNNLDSKRLKNIDDQTILTKKSEENTQDLNILKENDNNQNDVDHVVRNNDIDDPKNSNQDTILKLSQNAPNMNFPDHVEVHINGDNENDITEKKHYSYDDLKNDKIQWQAGNHGNQEIFISSKSTKRKIGKRSRKNKYEVTFVPFTVNMMNINSGEKSMFAVLTRNTMEEHRAKTRMKRIEGNYKFQWKTKTFNNN